MHDCKAQGVCDILENIKLNSEITASELDIRRSVETLIVCPIFQEF